MEEEEKMENEEASCLRGSLDFCLEGESNKWSRHLGSVHSGPGAYTDQYLFSSLKAKTSKTSGEVTRVRRTGRMSQRLKMMLIPLSANPVAVCLFWRPQRSSRGCIIYKEWKWIIVAVGLPMPAPVPGWHGGLYLFTVLLAFTQPWSPTRSSLTFSYLVSPKLCCLVTSQYHST